LLGGTEAVGLSRVEEVDPELERALHGGHVLLFIERAPIAAELPSPEADPGDIEVGAAELRSLHVTPGRGVGGPGDPRFA
jgi:hypothetical protein